MSNEETRKWKLVRTLSKASDIYGDKIIEALEESGVTNTQQLTADQAAEYCKRHGIKEETFA